MQKNLATFVQKYHRIIPEREVYLLLEDILNKSYTWCLAHPNHLLKKSEQHWLTTAIRQRASGMPLAYILGHKDFYGRRFFVNPSVLIPRPETELMIDYITTHHPNPSALVDIGTGSGNIITTLACEIPHAHTFIATDYSAPALDVARTNATRLAPQKSIQFYHADLFVNPQLLHALLHSARTAQDLIITANLPYVNKAWKDTLRTQKASHGLFFEPPEALWSEHNGLAHYQRFCTQFQLLRTALSLPQTTILYEINDDQSTPLSQMLMTTLSDCPLSITKDLAGKKRLVIQHCPPIIKQPDKKERPSI